MSNAWMRGLAAAIAVALCSAGAAAQDVESEVKRTIDTLKRDNPDVQVRINPRTGLPISITGLTARPDPTTGLAAARRDREPTEDEIKRAVESWLVTSGLTAATRTKNAQAQFKTLEVRKDRDLPGQVIVTAEQRVNGVLVFGSGAKVTVEKALVAVTKFTGTPSAVAITDTIPTVSEDAAKAAARAKLEELSKNAPTIGPTVPLPPDLEKSTPSAVLTVFDPALLKSTVKGGTRLAWLVSYDTFRVFVDAKTGEAFHAYQDQPTAMVRRIFDLAQSTSGGTKVLDEESLERAATLDTDVERAFQNSGLVRDFYFLVLSRNSYDDNDGSGPKGNGTLQSYVRHGNTKNAFWCTKSSSYCPAANSMIYGPGYAGAIDIVGHEMTHGVVAYEANLVYSDEPGAVNEAMADIFGTLIEFYAKGEAANWLIGEGAPGYSAGAPLRSMENPHLADADGNSRFDKSADFSATNRGQPDHFDELLTPDDALCASTWNNDNGCVHFNSGILNKFAYLIAEGGTHRDKAVTGIGKVKLARIAYRTLTAQLNESSGLIEAADGFLLSCLELADNNLGGVVRADCEQVRAAQQAVGLFLGS